MVTSAESTRHRPSRMLAAVALAGAAALVSGCGIQSDPGTAPGPPAIVGADPVPLDAAQLQAPGLFDEVSEQGSALRWLVPGESIAVVVGGSGAGGECIPQPQAARLEPNAPSIVVRFDPSNPEVMCTADFALHGWELGLAQPVDADAVVPVRFVNLQGTDDTIDLELGPDDVLAGETADPQPTEIPDAGEVPAPEPIPGEQIPDGIDVNNQEGLAVRWAQPGGSLAVILFANSSPNCRAEPISASVTGPGSIALAFEPPPVGHDCATVGVMNGWQVELDSTISATLPVEVTITGLANDGSSTSRTLESGDVLELP